MKIISGLRLGTDRNLFLTGGEVFARPDFEEICEGIAKKDLPFGFGTNGMFPERLKNLLSSQSVRNALTTIQFSLDGTKEEHERIRGTGTFEPLIESIRLAKESGVPINLCTVLQKENENCANGVKKLVAELGVENHRFQLFSKADNLLTENIDRYQDILVPREYYLAIRSPHVPGKGCLAGIQSCVIRSNGVVEACRLSAVGNVPHLAMGRLSDFDFNMDALLGSEQARQTLRMVGQCPGCALYCAR